MAKFLAYNAAHKALPSTPRACPAGTLSAIRRHAKVLLGTVATAALLTVGITVPTCGEESIWTHNGSLVRWVSSGRNRWLYYVEPRPALAAIGVRSGTLLFEGQGAANILVGTAYVFSENCSPTPYHVEGVIYSETEVRLDGAAPIVDPYSCEVADSTSDSNHAVLHFHYMMTIDQAPYVAQGK